MITLTLTHAEAEALLRRATQGATHPDAEKDGPVFAEHAANAKRKLRLALTPPGCEPEPEPGSCAYCGGSGMTGLTPDDAELCGCPRGQEVARSLSNTYGPPKRLRGSSR